MQDKLRQNRISFTNISSIKAAFGQPLTVYENSDSPSPADGAPPLVPLTPTKVGDQSQRNCERFSTTSRCCPDCDAKCQGRGIGFIRFLSKSQLFGLCSKMFFAEINLRLKESNRRWATRGQTLIELMVAMSVMSIGLLGIFAVLSQSLGLNRVVANQYIAANLAAEGIEVTKNIIDSNILKGEAWNAGLSSGNFALQYDSDSLNRDWVNSDLKFDSNTGRYGYLIGGETNFRRTISITNINANEIQVKSLVKWRDRGGAELEVDLEDRFFNWR